MKNDIMCRECLAQCRKRHSYSGKKKVHFSSSPKQIKTEVFILHTYVWEQLEHKLHIYLIFFLDIVLILKVLPGKHCLMVEFVKEINDKLSG